MDNLMEAPTISQQILNKLGYDFIRRYEMKQQFSVSQFKTDINHLLSQLRLYSHTIRQIRSMPTVQSQYRDQKFHQIVFRVIQCIAKLPQKIQVHNIKQDNTIRLYESTCEICSNNLNAKKIKNIQRQIFQYFPMIQRDQIDNRQPLQEQQQRDFDNDTTNEEIIVKKMIKLQHNLSEKQSGLVRSIEQFQNFRNNLLVGLPKNNDLREGFGSFNSRQYVFQLSSHFFNNIQQLEGKIANLKVVCKKTSQKSIQCNRKEVGQSESSKQADPIKVANLRAQAESRKLVEIRNKFEQSIQRYQIQCKHLNNQISQLEQQNKILKEDFYVEKFKKGSRQKSKPVLINSKEDRYKKLNQSARFSQNQGLPIQLELANELIYQIGQRKSQIQSCGAKMQQVFPLIKTTFKRAFDSFLNQRLSSNNDRKRLGKVEDSEGEESNMSISNKKGRRSSFKGIRGSYLKKQLSKFNPNIKYQNSPAFTITNQLSYKIQATQKRMSKILVTKDQFINSTVQKFFSKTAGKSLYKRSTLQTEGNVLSRKLHVKLSSISSQVKENSTIGHYQNINSQLYSQDNESSKFLKHKNSDILQIDQNQFSQLLSTENKKFKYLKHRKSNRSEDLLSVFNKKDQKNILKIQDSIMIKAFNNRSIQPAIMSAFFKPQLQAQSKKGSSIDLSQTSQNWKKIFKKNECNTTLYKAISKKGKSKKQILRLDELSFLTVFFLMMAKAHLNNPTLYSQLKNCICDPSKKLFKQGHGQEMIKQLMGQIVLKHRKCKQSSVYLCKHLTQFLNMFQICISGP